MFDPLCSKQPKECVRGEDQEASVIRDNSQVITADVERQEGTIDAKMEMRDGDEDDGEIDLYLPR